MLKGEDRNYSQWPQVLCLVLLALTGLSCERAPQQKQLSLKQQAVLPEKKSIATVNNEEINLDQFNRVYRWRSKSIAYPSQALHGEIEKALNIKLLIASQLIEKYLLEKEAARRNVKITEEDIQEARQKIVESFPDARIYN